MTRELLTCLRCGHTAPEVALTIVDLEAEARAEGRGVRTVEVEHRWPLAHVDEVTVQRVPERYAPEYRCRDRAACERRYAAQVEPMPDEAPSAAADDEVVPWIA